MSSAVGLHGSLVCCRAGRVRLVREGRAEGTQDGAVGAAASLLMLASYRNQCIHVFLRPALLAAALHITRATLRGGDHGPRVCFSQQGGLKGINVAFCFSPSPSTEELFNYFCFLQEVFSNEFIFVPGKSFQVLVSPFLPGRVKED